MPFSIPASNRPFSRNISTSPQPNSRPFSFSAYLHLVLNDASSNRIGQTWQTHSTVLCGAYGHLQCLSVRFIPNIVVIHIFGAAISFASTSPTIPFFCLNKKRDVAALRNRACRLPCCTKIAGPDSCKCGKGAVSPMILDPHRRPLFVDEFNTSFLAKT
jgi:hypothetical protein